MPSTDQQNEPHGDLFLKKHPLATILDFIWRICQNYNSAYNLQKKYVGGRIGTE